jgi:four helix bundle protein
MNNPEVTMHDPTPATGFDALDKALDAAHIAISLATRVPAPLRPIADQIIRSASSVPAHLAEGHGRFGRDRLHHCRVAYASAKQVDSHLRVLLLSEAVHRGKATTALILYGEPRAMTWRLIHPKR